MQSGSGKREKEGLGDNPVRTCPEHRNSATGVDYKSRPHLLDDVTARTDAGAGGGSDYVRHIPICACGTAESIVLLVIQLLPDHNISSRHVSTGLSLRSSSLFPLSLIKRRKV